MAANIYNKFQHNLLRALPINDTYIHKVLSDWIGPCTKWHQFQLLTTFLCCFITLLYCVLTPFLFPNNHSLSPSKRSVILNLPIGLIYCCITLYILFIFLYYDSNSLHAISIQIVNHYYFSSPCFEYDVPFPQMFWILSATAYLLQSYCKARSYL